MNHPHTIFYSWQSDETAKTNAKTNRYFVEDALKRAAKKLGRDEIGVVEVDRDTKGVSGTPDIAATIFGKIDAADGFVGDVSIINPGADDEGWRLTPNPNVLLELGYAKKSLGPERVVLVMNTAGGDISKLPFDLQGRRVTPYHLLRGATKEERKEVRDRLVEGLYHALKALVDLGSAGASDDQEIQESQLERAETELVTWMNESRARFYQLVGTETFESYKDVDESGQYVLPKIYRYGLQEVAYVVVPATPLDIRGRSRLGSLKAAELDYTGWPILAVLNEAADSSLRPRLVKGSLERLALTGDKNPFSSDFWRADGSGRVYLVSGYSEDFTDRAGTLIDISRPIWRIAEALLHAGRYAKEVSGDEADIVFKARLHGLRGRRLGYIDKSRDQTYKDRTSHEEMFEGSMTTNPREIDERLAVLVHEFLIPFYEMFGLYEVHPQNVQQTIETFKTIRIR